MKKDRGFTIIELMVTISVAAILAAVAIPSMQGLIARNQITSANNELLSAIMYARSEAVLRGVPVRVCNSSTTTASSTESVVCSTDDSWASGWIVFVDADSDDSRTTTGTSEPVLRVFTNTSNTITITPASGNARGVVYDRTGRAAGVPASGSHTTTGNTFTTCSTKLAEGRVLSVSLSGRASTAKKTPC